MTAPFNAEAERAAAEAMHDAWCMEGGACPTRDRHVAVTRRDAARVLAAVVPFLAEHFAQAVEATDRRIVTGVSTSGPLSSVALQHGDACYALGYNAALDAVAANLRAAATPTEEETT